MNEAASLRVTVRDTGASLSAAQRELAAFLAANGASPRCASRAELLAEEVARNAILHGAAPEVEMTGALADGECVLAFEDAGRPFDPLAAPIQDPPTDLATARIGGLGLVLLHRFTTGRRYERLPAGRNRLELTLSAAA